MFEAPLRAFRRFNRLFRWSQCSQFHGVARILGANEPMPLAARAAVIAFPRCRLRLTLLALDNQQIVGGRKGVDTQTAIIDGTVRFIRLQFRRQRLNDN